MTVTSVQPARSIPLDGCFNFRDCGGLPTVCQGPVRRGMLFRGDAPHDPTTSDVGKLNSLQIKTVIDLRGPTEKISKYSDYLPGVRTYELPMVDLTRDSQDFSLWSDPEYVATRYRSVLDNDGDAILEILAILTDPSIYPVLIHCTAGKDRTGVVIALLLSLLGVEDGFIITDYALSREAMPRLLAWLRETYPASGQQLSNSAPAWLIAAPETMRTMLNGLRAEFGQIENYAVQLGVGSAIGYIRAALLAANH
jgi:protein-tyrosine phosphatase